MPGKEVRSLSAADFLDSPQGSLALWSSHFRRKLVTSSPSIHVVGSAVYRIVGKCSRNLHEILSKKSQLGSGVSRWTHSVYLQKQPVFILF